MIRKNWSASESTESLKSESSFKTAFSRIDPVSPLPSSSPSPFLSKCSVSRNSEQNLLEDDSFDQNLKRFYRKSSESTDLYLSAQDICSCSMSSDKLEMSPDSEHLASESAPDIVDKKIKKKGIKNPFRRKKNTDLENADGFYSADSTPVGTLERGVSPFLESSDENSSTLKTPSTPATPDIEVSKRKDKKRFGSLKLLKKNRKKKLEEFLDENNDDVDRAKPVETDNEIFKSDNKDLGNKIEKKFSVDEKVNIDVEKLGLEVVAPNHRTVDIPTLDIPVHYTQSSTTLTPSVIAKSVAVSTPSTGVTATSVQNDTVSTSVPSPTAKTTLASETKTTNKVAFPIDTDEMLKKQKIEKESILKKRVKNVNKDEAEGRPRNEVNIEITSKDQTLSNPFSDYELNSRDSLTGSISSPNFDLTHSSFGTYAKPQLEYICRQRFKKSLSFVSPIPKFESRQPRPLTPEKYLTYGDGPVKYALPSPTLSTPSPTPIDPGIAPFFTSKYPRESEGENLPVETEQDEIPSIKESMALRNEIRKEHLYKVLVVGELGTGKTSIIRRYVSQTFSQLYRATIGVDFALKVINWDAKHLIRLQLWDIAGQERFGNMTRVYYKQAVAAFVVFDASKPASFDNVAKWKNDLDTKVILPDGSPIPIVLLANKCDEHKEGLVREPEKMDEFCQENKFAGWFEVSAKENFNIKEAVRFLIIQILNKEEGGSMQITDPDMEKMLFDIKKFHDKEKKSCAC